MRKPLCYRFWPPILASEIIQQIMIVPTRFLDIIFKKKIKEDQKMVDLGTPFKIQWAPGWDPESTNFPKLPQKVQ